MIKKALLIAIAITLVVMAGGGAYLYSVVNRNIDEQFAGTCTQLELNGSGEDIELDRERGFAYLSVFDRKAGVGPGQILRLDLNSSELQAVNALTTEPEHMHPHGISLYIDEAGERSLIMINHPEDRENGQDTIERFVEYSPGNYRYVESFSDPLITRANDLVATGPREFYVAQDTGQGTGVTVTDLVYFDGENYSVVADDIESGGGINVSADSTTLYVAETNGNAVRAFSRNSDGTVAVTQRIDVGTAPDNISVAEDGTLLVGAHSNVAALVMHFIMGSDSPSQVVRVDTSATPPTVDEIYLNAGEELSAGSGAVQYGNKLLIGSITDKKILVCEFD